MRTFRWTPEFHVSNESPFVPVWFSIPILPIHFFDNHSLFSIAQAVGKPLIIDAAMASLTRPSVARICIQVDLMKPIPEDVWIGMEGAIMGFLATFGT